MPAVAVTDRANLFGALEFSQAAAKAGVQPIIGCLLPVAADDAQSANGRRAAPCWLPVLVQNAVGYRNLLKLLSEAYLGGEAAAAPDDRDSGAPNASLDENDVTVLQSQSSEVQPCKPWRKTCCCSRSTMTKAQSPGSARPRFRRAETLLTGRTSVSRCVVEVKTTWRPGALDPSRSLHKHPRSHPCRA